MVCMNLFLFCLKIQLCKNEKLIYIKNDKNIFDNFKLKQTEANLHRQLYDYLGASDPHQILGFQLG